MGFDLQTYRAVAASTGLIQVIQSPEDILAELCPILEYLEPNIHEHMSVITPRNRPDAASNVRAIGAELIRYGFLTRGLLWRPPWRTLYESASMEQVVTEWRVQSIRALSYMAGADREQCRGYLEKVFCAVYDQLVLPLEREMASGWLRRNRNRPKWQSFFAEGILLSILMDHFTKPSEAK